MTAFPWRKLQSEADMRIIRPYGRSVVKRGEERRKLVPRTESLCAIPDFAKNNPHIIIAQWISALDKIIAKPRGTHKASPGLYDLRDKLGNACWDRMIDRHACLQTQPDEMKRVWQWKLHPYGKPEPEDTGKKHKRSKPDTPRKGRWYTAFAGGTDFDQLDFAGIAQALEDHLYRNQCRIHDGDPRSKRTENKKGLIAARAESVAKSLPAPADEKEPDWTEQDERKFLKVCRDPAVDPAVIILNENRKLESDKKCSIFSGAAGRVIADCYGKYFSDDAGGVLTRRAIRDDGRGGELALWDAVRTYYQRLLSAKPKHSLNRKLPDNAGALVALLRARGTNRQINDLIRLGRLLHYDRDSAQGDSAPDFDSDKQADIKRAEAFVRVWRTAISQARCTVANWIDPEKKADTDILGDKKALLNHFEETFQVQQTEKAKKHAALLFGTHVDVLGDVPLKDLCLVLAYLTMQCRHNIVHFISRKEFVSALKSELNKEGNEEKLKTALKIGKPPLCKLFDHDLEKSGEQIIKEITGAKLPHFARQQEMDAFVSCVGVLDDTDIVLPRFRRLLLRLENTGQSGNLPKPENITALQDELERLENQSGDPAARERTKREATLARYTGLKMLYERPFRRWLAEQNANELNEWLQEACDRATQAARKLNSRNSDYADLIVAKAEEVTPLQDRERITDFMQRLTALTASEMRVQKGYDSNPEQARKQAGWIDNLLCDVLGRAFHAFLASEDAACGWLLCLDPENDEHRQDPAKVTPPALPADQTPGWLKLLYAVLYMISRDEISRLLHQFRKWEILEAKAGGQTDEDSAGLRRVLTLCLRMSEAKFDGQEAACAESEINDFFEESTDFDRAFPVAEGGALLATRRGLRQIMRFGHLLLLRPIFAQHRIASADVEALQTLEGADGTGLSKIARAQRDRKKLHETLSRKKSISNDKLEEYQSVLKTITQHRDLCAKVRLTNHLRLHRLMIRLWSRLLDFAGLWERDRFFVHLVLTRRKGLNRRDAWNEVDTLFSGTKRDPSRLRNIRNALAHFDFLGKDWSDNLTQPDFTTYVNDVRDLMAYDRKLKNAISKSVIDILDEEGFILKWKMNGEYRLCNPAIESKKLQHFKKSSKKIWEPMHNDHLVAMVLSLFGQEKSARRSVTQKAQGHRTRPQKNTGGYGSGRKK